MPAEVAVVFARRVRQAGIDVPTSSVATFVAALAEVDAADRDDLYWAGRAVLVNRPEDVARYDRAFRAYWLGVDPPTVAPGVTPTVALSESADGTGTDAGDEPSDPSTAPAGARYSAQEALRRKDFAAYSPAELAEARRLMAGVRLRGATRRSRRLRPTKAKRGRPDMRTTVRRAVRTGGEPIRPGRLRPSTKPRRVVLLCDISGSMDAYARALLRFLHVAVAGRGKVEAFTLGTRMTRLTKELSVRHPDEALARASASVPDWSGGTRLGEGIKAFNDEWGRRGISRGAVVVILSDGWDRGDPAVLAGQMARLGRVAHKVVWVNPLKASPGYQPLARGMAAALPYVDEFVEGHNLDALAALVEVISS